MFILLGEYWYIMSTTNKEYDVYYSTGGGSLVGGGADVWVNHWIEEIAPKLKVVPKLMIHRNKPIVEWTEEQHKDFKKRIDRGESGNNGRQVQKKLKSTFKETFDKKKRTYKDVLKTELKHYWQGDDPEEFGEILNDARRIHILHGYYHPHRYIRDNKDKIYNVSDMIGRGYSITNIKKEIRKCIVLCANCHQEKHNTYLIDV